MKTIKLITRMTFPNIRQNQNYKRISNGDVLNGNSVLYLLELASPMMQAIIMLDIQPTNEEETVKF